jgi:hypothetical protein
MEEVGTADIMDIIMPAVSSTLPSPPFLPPLSPYTRFAEGFAFNHANNIRDVKLLGECQSGIKKLADLLGWGQELEDLYARESQVILATAPNKAAAIASVSDPFRTPDAAPTTSTATAAASVGAVQSTTEPAEPAHSTTEPAQPTNEPVHTKSEPVQSTPQPEHAAPNLRNQQDKIHHPAQSTPEPAQSAPQPAEQHST